jgi:hypothetical protein
MIEMGQLEPSLLRISLVEPLTLHRRLWLDEGPIPFVYVLRQQAMACWPELPSEMRSKGYTIEVTYQTRRLRFASGYTPANLVSIRKVPGTPHTTK